MMDDDLEALRAERDALRVENERLIKDNNETRLVSQIHLQSHDRYVAASLEREARLIEDLHHARHTANLFYSLSNTYVADAAIYLGKHPAASDGWDAGEQVGEGQ